MCYKEMKFQTIDQITINNDFFNNKMINIELKFRVTWSISKKMRSYAE